MALTGTHDRKLDEKNRLAIPRQLYEEFEEAKLEVLYIAPEKERYLSLFSPAGYSRLLKKLEEQSGNLDELNKSLRIRCSQVAKVELDAQSRIRIPDRLVEFAVLQREVKLIGVNDHAEIWNPETWDTYRIQNAPT